MADYDLEFGKKNDYKEVSYADGGQGEFGAISPNDWRQPGTSPVGQQSWAGADDGGEEPWFAEAVSTVFLDLAKAEDTLKAFTKDAAVFKVEAFAETKPFEFESAEACLEELTGSMGYDKFLEASPKNLAKAWDALHPDPEAKKKKEAKKPAKKEAAPAEKE